MEKGAGERARVKEVREKRKGENIIKQKKVEMKKG